MDFIIDEKDIDTFVSSCHGVITARDSDTQEHLGTFTNMAELRSEYPSLGLNIRAQRLAALPHHQMAYMCISIKGGKLHEFKRS